MSVIDISPTETFSNLRSDPNSLLIDVRTGEEFAFVGVVNANEISNRLALISWKILPDMSENPNFANDLEKSTKTVSQNKDDLKLYFLCKSGARSKEAAIYCQNIGYKNCYNVANGFEGDLDENSRRGNINGWKASNLPWRQQ